MSKKIVIRIQQTLCMLSLYVYTLPIRATVPTLPPDDVPSSTTDFIDVMANLVYRNLRYICIIVGAGLMVASAWGVFHAFQVARERQDLGHFVKYGAVIAIVVVLSISLIYYGNSMLPAA